MLSRCLGAFHYRKILQVHAQLRILPEALQMHINVLGDHSNTLMSLFDLGNPKNACHIQRSNDVTASKTMVGSQI